MIDPFTSDVIAAGLDCAAAEMFDVLRKTAMSPIIYEVLDVGTGITDASGALVSSGAGQSAIFSTSHGGRFNCPVEIAEARYGFDVLEKTLVTAPEIADEYQGGAGLNLKYRMRSSGILSTGYAHANVPVWVGSKASPGGLNRLSVTSENGECCVHHLASGVQVHAGDVVELQTAYGGSLKKTDDFDQAS